MKQNNSSVFAGGQQQCRELPLAEYPLFFPARCGSVEEVWRFCLAPGLPTLKELINPTRRIWLLTSGETHWGWLRSGWMSSRATSTWPGTYPRRWVRDQCFQALALDPFVFDSYPEFWFFWLYLICNICIDLCLTYRRKTCAYTYTIANKHTYVVVSYSRIICLSLGSLKINSLSSLSSSLMTLHGYFKLVAAEMWEGKIAPSDLHCILNLNLSLLFTVRENYNSTRFVRKDLPRDVDSYWCKCGVSDMCFTSEWGWLVGVNDILQNPAAAPH